MARRQTARTPDIPADNVEVFPNPCPDRDYVITHVAPEFTSLCPVTGQPDFGTVTIEYVADRCCVELKSLKLYLQTFRNEGIFYEAVTNRLLDELVTALAPRWMRVTTDWTPRGGLHSRIVATHPVGDPAAASPANVAASAPLRSRHAGMKRTP